jgi:hypothetical protein
VQPIPTPSQEEDIYPIPRPKEKLEVEEAFVHDKIGSTISGFVGCITNPGGCAESGIEGVIEAGVWIVEKTLLNQITNEGESDAILNAASDPVKAQLYLKSLSEDPNAGKRFGMLSIADNTTDVLLDFPVPVNSGQYLASINPFSSAHAQGSVSNLAGSDIILEIWVKVRNVAYALSAVVMVIIGFLIMIRKRLDPRTSVSVSNSLPRIVIALILITFSFAISGLMIDVARLIAGMLDSFVSIGLPAQLGVAGIFSAVLLGIGGFFALPGHGPVAAVAVLLLALILALMLLIVSAIIIYKLIMRYIIFLLMTIFAPLFFLGGAIPGAEGLIYGWFRRTAAALLAIPATALIIKLSFAIGFSGFGQINIPENIPDLPLMYGQVEVIFGWFFAAPVIGIGLFFFATKVPDIVDELMGVKEMGARKGVGPGVLAAPVAIPAQAINPLYRAGTAATTAHNIATVLGEKKGPIGFLGSRLEKFTKPIYEATSGKGQAAGDEAAKKSRDLDSTVSTHEPPPEKERPERPPGP